MFHTEKSTCTQYFTCSHKKHCYSEAESKREEGSSEEDHRDVQTATVAVGLLKEEGEQGCKQKPAPWFNHLLPDCHLK